MKASVSLRLVLLALIFLFCPAAMSSQGWSAPTNLTDPGQLVGGIRSVSGAGGESVSLWWDLGENALVSTRFSPAGTRHDSIAAASQLETSFAEFEVFADQSLNTIVALFPQFSSSAASFQFVRSDDGGSSWSSPVRAAPRFQTPRLLVSQDFNKLILFGTLGAEGARSLQFVRSIDGGVTWSLPEVMFSESAVWSMISVSAAADDNFERIAVFLGYSSRNNPEEPYVTSTHGLISADGGMTWRENLSLDGWAIRRAKFHQASNQIQGVAERRQEGAGVAVKSLATIRASGYAGQWLEPNVLETSREIMRVTEIISSGDGETLAFAWSSGTSWGSNYLVKVVVSSDGGGSWQSARAVSSHANLASISADGLRMSTDGSRLALVWGASIAWKGDTELFSSESSDRGVTWTTPTVHSTVEIAGVERLPQATLAMGESGIDLRLSFIQSTGLMTKFSEDGGVAWSEPLYLARPVLPALAPRLLRVSDHELVAAWIRQRDTFDTFIEVSTSADGGATWAQPQALSEASSSRIRNPMLGAGGGAILGVWQERRDGVDSVRVTRSFDSGKTWESNGLSVIPANMQPIGLHVAKSTGRTLLFYTEMFVSPRNMTAIASNDFGKSWFELPLVATGMTLMDSVISEDGNFVHLAFRKDDGSGRGPLIMTSLDGGKSWSQSLPLPVTADVSFQGRFQASKDGLRVVFLSFERVGFFHYLRRRYTVNGGLTWLDSASEPMEGIDTWGRLISSGSETGDSVSIAWRKGNNAVAAVSQNGGASWTAPQVLFPLASSMFASTGDPLFQGSADGRHLVMVGVVQDSPAWPGKVVSSLLASSSSDSGLTWSPRRLVASNTYIDSIGTSVSADGSSAVAIWLAESGMQSGLAVSHVKVASAFGINSQIFASGFEH